MKSVKLTTLLITTLRLCLSLSVLAGLPVVVDAAGSQEITIKNAFVSRTISWFAGPLRTTNIEMNGVRMLDGVGVEFLIDLDYKGEPLTLSPSDFEIRNIDTIKIGQESQVVIDLHCLNKDLPLHVYLKYHYAPGMPYMQKSLKIAPCKEAVGAMLRQVTLEYCKFKREFLPVTKLESAQTQGFQPERGKQSETLNNQSDVGKQSDINEQLDILNTRFAIMSETKKLGLGLRSEFGVFDPKSNKGAFFFVVSATGAESYDLRRGLVMTDNASLPLEKGFETGRATIGAVVGSIDDLYKQFRRFLWRNYPPYAVCDHPYIQGVQRVTINDEKLGVYLNRFFKFRNRFEKYFEVCQRVYTDPSVEGVVGEAHIVDNKGFIILFNTSKDSRKVRLALDGATLNLKGRLKLSDWTQLDSGAEMGNVESNDRLEIELAPLSEKIIGINVE
jgi:hypothetical protein